MCHLRPHTWGRRVPTRGFTLALSAFFCGKFYCWDGVPGIARNAEHTGPRGSQCPRNSQRRRNSQCPRNNQCPSRDKGGGRGNAKIFQKTLPQPWPPQVGSEGGQGGSFFFSLSAFTKNALRKIDFIGIFWPFSYVFYREMVHFVRGYCRSTHIAELPGPKYVSLSPPTCGVVWLHCTLPKG